MTSLPSDIIMSRTLHKTLAVSGWVYPADQLAGVGNCPAKAEIPLPGAVLASLLQMLGELGGKGGRGPAGQSRPVPPQPIRQLWYSDKELFTVRSPKAWTLAYFGVHTYFSEWTSQRQEADPKLHIFIGSVILCFSNMLFVSCEWSVIMKAFSFLTISLLWNDILSGFNDVSCFESCWLGQQWDFLVKEIYLKKSGDFQADSRQLFVRHALSMDFLQS